MQQLDSVPIAVTALIITILSLLLNSFGIYILSQIKWQRTHQNLILINLSTTEILMSVTAVVYYILLCNEDREKIDELSWVFHVIGGGAGLVCYLLMTMITLERLAMTILTIKYKVIVTHRKMIIILVCIWITGPSCSLTHYFLGFLNPKILYPTIDICILVITASTYSHVYYKLVKRRKTIQRNKSENPKQRSDKENPSKRNSLSKFYSTSGLIILTFIIFVAVPGIIREHLFNDESLEYALLYAIRIINFAVDPCIYIFLQKPTQNLIKTKLQAKMSRNSGQ